MTFGSSFWKKGQCIHILWCIFKSNITMIAKVCDRKSRQDSWFENRLVWKKNCSLDGENGLEKIWKKYRGWENSDLKSGTVTKLRLLEGTFRIVLLILTVYHENDLVCFCLLFNRIFPGIYLPFCSQWKLERRANRAKKPMEHNHHSKHHPHKL